MGKRKRGSGEGKSGTIYGKAAQSEKKQKRDLGIGKQVVIDLTGDTTTDDEAIQGQVGTGSSEEALGSAFDIFDLLEKRTDGAHPGVVLAYLEGKFGQSPLRWEKEDEARDLMHAHERLTIWTKPSATGTEHSSPAEQTQMKCCPT
ncbi:MAG: hypothetical protein V3V61_07875 [Gammaproteobacteria bacterium]